MYVYVIGVFNIFICYMVFLSLIKLFIGKLCYEFFIFVFFFERFFELCKYNF